MSKKLLYISILTISIAITSCIEVFYDYENSDYESLLVIDGKIITNSVYQYVKISRATSPAYPTHKAEYNCQVQAEDKDGNTFIFYENSDQGAGVYQAEIPAAYLYFGNKFKLYVKTKEGTEYESDFNELLPAADIDSIFYTLELNSHVNELGETVDGVQFHLNMPIEDGYSKYYRIMVNEAWEYHASFPITKYYAINESYSLTLFSGAEDYSKNVCYKSADLKEIILVNNAYVSDVNQKTVPLHFVTNETQRLLYRYSILVTQYSLTKEEYDYWETLKEIAQKEDGLFGSQPVNALGNFSCITDPKEKVLGFFSVSDYSTKRVYIDNVPGLPISSSDFTCEKQKVTSDAFAFTLAHLTRNELPYYVPENPSNDPTGIYTAYQSCFDCSMAGGQFEIFEFWKNR